MLGGFWMFWMFGMFGGREGKEGAWGCGGRGWGICCIWGGGCIITGFWGIIWPNEKNLSGAMFTPGGKKYPCGINLFMFIRD